jgi:hypothetical protein
MPSLIALFIFAHDWAFTHESFLQIDAHDVIGVLFATVALAGNRDGN